MNEIAVGIDIGGTNTVIGFVDKKGKIIANTSLATTDYEKADLFVKACSDRINEMLHQHPKEIKIVGIGIGAPNGNYYKGTIEFAPNLKWEGIIQLSKLFKKYYEVPVIVTNDANAAARGEMMYGGAKKMKDFIVITLGTGVGSGIVVNGEIVFGHDGFAGEVGHSIVKQKGRKCGCGRRGCLETYASASGIKRTALELIAESSASSLLDGHTIKSLSALMIDEAALKGDKIAKQTFELTGKILGEALANAVTYTSPEAIFLFGGLAQAGNLIFKPTKRHMEKNLLPIYKGKVKLLPSALKEADAAILGASALVWMENK